MTAIVVTLVALFVLLASIQVGLMRTTIVVVIATLVILPRTLFTLAPDGGALHVGISSPTPTVTTFGIAVLAGLAALTLRWGPPAALALWLPFAAWLAVGWNSEWARNPIVLSGILQYVLGAATWALGAILGRRFVRDVRLRSSTTMVVLVALAVQLGVVALQAAGIRINPMSLTNEAQLAGRFNGTLSHPNDLGKVVLLCLVLVLPLYATRMGITFSRRLGLTLAAAFIVLVATGGRAVTVGAGVMVLFWILLQPGVQRARTHKARALAASVVGGGVISLVLAERFEEDPTGGARSVLSDLAVQQIATRPWWGTGPNQYMEVVGAVDPLTASGVPVHNSFLLAAAELGVPGALLLALPFAWVVIRSVLSLRSSRPGASWGRVVVAACPALIIIGTTGWGLLGSYVFPLLCLAFGAVAGALASGRGSGSPDMGLESADLLTTGRPVRSR